MQTHMNIPNQLHVGFQSRSDTYTGKLGYIIYTDEKGTKRKEGSWEGWRSNDITPLDIDNEPTSGFVLNRKAGGVGSGWGWNDRMEKVRVYDPRDFEFEISVPNLLFILSECNSIKGKGLDGEFVYAWFGTELILLPVTSQEYTSSVEFTAAKSMKVTKADMIEGCVYQHKDMRKLVYIGRIEFRDMDQSFWSRADQYKTLQSTMKKTHVFYDIDADTFVSEKGFTKLARKISNDQYDDFANLYSRYVSSPFHDIFSHLELREISIDVSNITNERSYGETFRYNVLIDDGSDSLTLHTQSYRYSYHNKPPTPTRISRSCVEQQLDTFDQDIHHGGGLNWDDFKSIFPDASKLKFYVPVYVMKSGEVLSDCTYIKYNKETTNV